MDTKIESGERCHVTLLSVSLLDRTNQPIRAAYTLPGGDVRVVTLRPEFRDQVEAEVMRAMDREAGGGLS